MRRRVALGAASLIILLCLIHAIQDPMLVQVSDGPLGPIGIPSPFRDRNPETEGLHFLKDLGTDRCQRQLANLCVQRNGSIHPTTIAFRIEAILSIKFNLFTAGQWRNPKTTLESVSCTSDVSEGAIGESTLMIENTEQYCVTIPKLSAVYRQGTGC